MRRSYNEILMNCSCYGDEFFDQTGQQDHYPPCQNCGNPGEYAVESETQIIGHLCEDCFSSVEGEYYIVSMWQPPDDENED